MATLVEPDAPQEAPVSRKDGPVRAGLRETGELTAFGGHAVKALPGSLNFFSESLRQAALMMQGTLLLLFVMQMFFGVTVANFAFNLLRGIGASDYLGLVTGYGTPRQFTTTMFGYVFTAKVCCGMAAELGAMKIQQEVDALESTGVDPYRYLVGTRLLGTLLFVPVATFVGMVGAIAGAYVTSVDVIQGIAGNQLMSVHWSTQSVGDLVFAMVVVGIIGVVTALAACFYGLRTVGGPAAVGNAVAKSLVFNLVVLHVIAVLGAVLVYGLDQKLPIGG